MIGIQATSPIKEAKDFDNAGRIMEEQKLDSLFSCAEIGDFFIWRRTQGELNSTNYDYKNRKRRQDFGEQYLENGSFYVFKPEIILTLNNRLGGKIGFCEMEVWKSFELDKKEDIKFLETIMKAYVL